MTGRELLGLLNAVAEENGRTNLGLVAAGCAFWGIVAIFPAISAVIAVFGIVADPGIVETQLELMEDVIPPAPYELFSQQLSALLAARPDRLGWASALSFGFALWSARAGVAALMLGLNSIHERPNRGNIRHVVVAMTITFGLIGAAVVSLLAVIVVPIVLAFLPLGTAATWALEAARWLIALAVIQVGLAVLYRYGPNARGERHPWVTPGAVMVMVFWLITSILFSTYLSNFGQYNEVYGSIGAVIALLFWLWISAYLVLLGAALNKVLRLRRRRRRSEERARHAL